MKKSVAILLVAMAFATSCNNFADKWIVVRFQNNSSRTVYYNIQCNNNGGVIVFEHTNSAVVLPGSEKDLTLSYSHLTNRNENNVQAFVYDTDTVDKYGWDLVRDQNLILKRYDLKYYKKRRDRDKTSNLDLVFP